MGKFYDIVKLYAFLNNLPLEETVSLKSEIHEEFRLEYLHSPYSHYVRIVYLKFYYSAIIVMQDNFLVFLERDMHISSGELPPSDKNNTFKTFADAVEAAKQILLGEVKSKKSGAKKYPAT